MARRKKPAGAAAGASTAAGSGSGGAQVFGSDLALHDLFEQQRRQILERADLDDEQKERILVAMSCPCCGAGAMSYTVRLKR